MYSFPNVEPVCCSVPVLNVAFWPAYRFLRGKVRWSGIPMSLSIFQFVVIHTVKGFNVVNETEVKMFFWNSLAFSIIQCMVTIWSLVLLPFLKPVCTSTCTPDVQVLLKPGLKNFEPYLDSMIWATVSSQSYFYWLYRASPSLATKNIVYNQSDFGIDHLVMSMCRVISCVVGRGCFLWQVHSLGKTFLAFALLHFVLQCQTCWLLQVSLDFLLLHSSPLW